MQRLFPLPGVELDGSALATLYRHPVPAAGAWVRATMVTSADGATAGPDGSSRPLSTPADHALLVALRRAADVVLVGAATAAGEGYRPVRTPIAVASTALDLDLDAPLYRAPSTVVATTAAAPPHRRDAVRCRLVVVAAGPAGAVDPAAAVAALAGLGLARVLCEGGPRLLGSVIDAGVLDELCLTIVPSLLGGDSARIAAGRSAPGPPVGMDLASVCAADGALLLRWVRPGRTH